MRTKNFFALILVLLLFASGAEAKRYITEPLLVPESPYAGMTFYVYRPYNMPKGWYVTLDGYPVKKNSDGMWVYGTSEGPNLVATSYVVGSVVPSMAGLTKWVNDAQISELRSLPSDQLTAVNQTFTRSQMAQGQNYSSYIPDWKFRHDFMTVGSWKGTVDRMGVLDDPVAPVAWKGTKPKVIYVWTGNVWYQVDVGGKTPINALNHDKYKIKRFVRNSNLKWYAQDVPILAQQAKDWGYYWLGEVHINK